ncbi:hypothetical protein FGB62_220g00 [Gracilaria domingensis]|nr:hypothetical protein FGB62_220g00 [Gracilaria domingensis]
MCATAAERAAAAWAWAGAGARAHERLLRQAAAEELPRDVHGAGRSAHGASKVSGSTEAPRVQSVRRAHVHTNCAPFAVRKTTW